MADEWSLLARALKFSVFLSWSHEDSMSRTLHDRKTEHFKALAKSDHSSAIADHVKTTGHDIKWPGSL